MKYIELKERSKEEILNYLLDKQLENIGLIQEKEELENKERKLNKYLLQRKEEWENCQDREKISSKHYIMLIKELLEILDKIGVNKNEKTRN